MNTRVPWRYQPALDGVCALAVTAVLIFHARPDAPDALAALGVARLHDMRWKDVTVPLTAGCDHWDDRWRRGVESDDPDVAVLLVGRWEVLDRNNGLDFAPEGVQQVIAPWPLPRLNRLATA
jgi:hypothetical protein